MKVELYFPPMWLTNALCKYRGISAKACFVPFLLGFWAFAFAFAQSPTSAPSTAAPSQTHRLKISEVVMSQLVVQKLPPKYPEDSIRAGIEGVVVLEIGIDTAGAVDDVTVVSGDSTLAKAAADAVRQWKYKPYLVEDSPIAIDTQVTLNFHLARQPQIVPPPLGSFQDGNYNNGYFNLYYPLSRDWVRETEVVRKRFSASNHSQGAYVLLTEVHIPQDFTELRADSSFTVFALNHSSGKDTETCKLYLDALATSLHAQKEAKQKGDVSQFTFASHEFYRADFEYRDGASNRSTVCTSQKDYLLLWNIEGWSKKAVEEAVSTLSTLAEAPQPAPPEPPLPQIEAHQVKTATPSVVRVATGVSTGLLLKKVQPVYPQEARHERIQGKVLMNAVISKTGDVVDLEVIDGPIELAVSAVNAVRLWKYGPYLLNGTPVEVLTQIVVNYYLSP
jgi:TonB family protein